MSSVFFTGWRPDGAGIRRGDSYSVRFRHPDLPGAVITRTAYAVESEQHLGEFYVQVQTELTLCTDPERPGDTETWSRVDYDDWDRTWRTAAEAEEDARGRTIGEIVENAYCLNWDGKPW